jgi:hypothetical protein
VDVGAAWPVSSWINGARTAGPAILWGSNTGLLHSDCALRSIQYLERLREEVTYEADIPRKLEAESRSKHLGVRGSKMLKYDVTRPPLWSSDQSS